MSTSDVIQTDRLKLRPWRTDDAEAALGLYGDPQVARWLSPALGVVTDLASMRDLLARWAGQDERLTPPAGRWAVEALDDGRLVGGVALLPLPPEDEDLELSYQVAAGEQRRGFGVEAARAVVRSAFTQAVPELYVVARAANLGGVAVAQKLGFQWVGETSKYYDLRLQTYRLRPAELV